MIRQVRLMEIGSATRSEGRVFAFGTHPQATNEDYPALGTGMVTALAGDTTRQQKLRIIMDELLVGNYLEEIACRGQVDDDAYDSVPTTATPSDIARCSVPKGRR